MTDSSRFDALPRGPREWAALQTAHWLMRPLGFLESCRRRFGDTFTVRFAGHRTPLVIISDPAAIRELYSDRENRLTPGRAVALGPLARKPLDSASGGHGAPPAATVDAAAVPWPTRARLRGPRR